MQTKLQSSMIQFVEVSVGDMINPTEPNNYKGEKKWKNNLEE